MIIEFNNSTMELTPFLMNRSYAGAVIVNLTEDTTDVTGNVDVIFYSDPAGTTVVHELKGLLQYKKNSFVIDAFFSGLEDLIAVYVRVRYMEDIGGTNNQLESYILTVPLTDSVTGVAPTVTGNMSISQDTAVGATLSLVGSNLTYVKFSDTCAATSINLSSNKLDSIRIPDSLANVIETLNLSSNRLRRVEGLLGALVLTSLDLSYNNLNVDEVDGILGDMELNVVNYSLSGVTLNLLGNAIPTNTTAISTLTGYGWTVSVAS